MQVFAIKIVNKMSENTPCLFNRFGLWRENPSLAVNNKRKDFIFSKLQAFKNNRRSCFFVLLFGHEDVTISSKTGQNGTAYPRAHVAFWRVWENF